ncbi:beta-galactosidase [Paenibacillus sp. IITD108]|uniref:beta-galactosidase n=1 Tax=Paenibacillus sp. IITD108 TaxID=3116649 RepID=UPI002F417B25
MRKIYLISSFVIILLVVLAVMTLFKKDENNQTTTNNEVFPIGLWVSPPVDQITMERYKEIKDAGITFITGFAEWTGGEEAQKKSLDFAAANDLKVILRDPSINALGMDELEQMKDKITAYSSHPAYMGHVFYDEPSRQQFEWLTAMKDEYSKHAPNGLAYINLFPTYASVEQKGGTSVEYVQDYLQTFKPSVLSYDHYPFLKKTSEDESANITEDYYYNLELIRSEALKANTPFWLFIQTLDFNLTHRDPTEDELRWQIYTSLAYGAKGIQYFTYWTPKPGGSETFGKGIIDLEGNQTRHYGEVQRLNKEVQALGRQLLNLKSEGVIHHGFVPPLIAELKESFGPIEEIAGDPAVIGCFSDDKGQSSILVVNASYEKSSSTTISLKPNIKNITLWKNGEPQTSKVVGGKVELELIPGQGVWIQLGK